MWQALRWYGDGDGDCAGRRDYGWTADVATSRLTWRATPTSTTRSSSCRPRSAARSSPSGTSAARWTMRWTRRGSGRGGRRGGSGAVARASSRRCFGGRHAGDARRGARSRRSSAQFNLPRDGVRGAHRRRRDGSRPAPLRDLRRPLRVLHPRRVGGRPDLPRDLRLPRIRARGSTRSTSASRCSSRTSCATCPGISRAAASTFRRRICGGIGCSEDGPRRASQRTPARGVRSRGGQGAAAPAGGARARLLRARRRGAAARATRGASSPPRSWARSIARILDRIERRGLRRLHPRRPDPAAAARADRRGHVGADGHRRAGQAARAGKAVKARKLDDDRPLGRRRDRRRLRRAERRRGARRARRARARARRAAAARRPRDGVHRSRDRRARRQRPARAVRLLPRDVRVPAADRRAQATSASSRRSRLPYLDADGRPIGAALPAAAVAAAPARRRPRLGRDARGAIAWPCCGSPARCGGRAASCGGPGRSTADAGRDGRRTGCTRTASASALREWLWEPLAVAALNQSPRRRRGGSVRARARGDVRAGSGAPRRSSLPTRPLHQMYAEPARGVHRGARRRGARRTRSARIVVERRARAPAVEVRGERIDGAARRRGGALVRAARPVRRRPPPRARADARGRVGAWRRCRS